MLLMAVVGPTGAAGSRAIAMKYGICNATTTPATNPAVIADSRPFFWSNGRAASAAINGAATKIADRCACHANHASMAVTAIFHLDGVSPRSSAIAVAILINAAATGGFQITDEIAMSKGAEAIVRHIASARNGPTRRHSTTRDRKSTRLNSSHSQISYAVFC